MMVRLQLRASVFSQDYQIQVRIKIRDFEVQEFAFARGKSRISFSKRVFEKFTSVLKER